MKGKIISVKYHKPVTTKYGEMHQHQVTIEKDGVNILCQYLCKSKDQNTFIGGKEAEYNLTEREYQGNTYYNIKPINNRGNSNFSRNIKKEQSKYSGFAMSYAKDLVVAGSIEANQMFPTAQKMLDWMVEQDKALENG